MMRAVRFAAKLGFEIEPATRAAIERYRADLAKASVPRLVDETYKTLAQPEAAHALVLMEELGLLEAVIPMSRRSSEVARRNARRAAGRPQHGGMGLAIGSGLSPEHPIVLAALMLDIYRDEHRRERGDEAKRYPRPAARTRLRARRHRADAAHPRGVRESRGADAPHAAPDAPPVLSRRADVLRDDGADILDRSRRT